ncbi:MAG TPA: hypothetical protein DCE71_02135 [Parachlamydiales bacterium]|nr:hypothetical protein [Parachlamydiales bacterium]
MAATIGAINLALTAQTESQIHQAESLKEQLKTLLLEVDANADAITKSGKAQLIGASISAAFGIATAGAGAVGVAYNTTQQTNAMTARTEIEKTPKAKNLAQITQSFDQNKGNPFGNVNKGDIDGPGIAQNRIEALLNKPLNADGSSALTDNELTELANNSSLKQKNKLIEQNASFKDGSAPEFSRSQSESDRKIQRATTIEQNIVHPLGKAAQELGQGIGAANSKRADAESTEAGAAQQANQTGSEIIKEVINLLAQANNNLISNLGSLAQAIR